MTLMSGNFKAEFHELTWKLVGESGKRRKSYLIKMSDQQKRMKMALDMNIGCSASFEDI